MIVEERIRDYLYSLEPDEGQLCEAIAREALERTIPVIKKRQRHC